MYYMSKSVRKFPIFVKAVAGYFFKGHDLPTSHDFFEPVDQYGHQVSAVHAKAR